MVKGIFVVMAEFELLSLNALEITFYCQLLQIFNIEKSSLQILVFGKTCFVNPFLSPLLLQIVFRIMLEELSM